MLRRKHGNTFEYLAVEQVLRRSAPAPLSDERREALRLRVMANLGPQEARAPEFLGVPRARWVALPAGLGVAATLVALLRADLPGGEGAGHDVAVSAGSVEVDGLAGGRPGEGQLLVARSAAWVALGKAATVGMGPGAAIRYDERDGQFSLFLESGENTVANSGAAMELAGTGWRARLTASSTATIRMTGTLVQFEVVEGSITVFDGEGQVFTVTAADPPLWLNLHPRETAPAADPEAHLPATLANPDGTPGPAEIPGQAPIDLPAGASTASPPAAVPPGLPSEGGADAGRSGQGHAGDPAGSPGGPRQDTTPPDTGNPSGPPGQEGEAPAGNANNPPGQAGGGEDPGTGGNGQSPPGGNGGVPPGQGAGSEAPGNGGNGESPPDGNGNNPPGQGSNGGNPPPGGGSGDGNHGGNGDAQPPANGNNGGNGNGERGAPGAGSEGQPPASGNGGNTPGQGNGNGQGGGNGNGKK